MSGLDISLTSLRRVRNVGNRRTWRQPAETASLAQWGGPMPTDGLQQRAEAYADEVREIHWAVGNSRREATISAYRAAVRADIAIVEELLVHAEAVVSTMPRLARGWFLSVAKHRVEILKATIAALRS